MKKRLLGKMKKRKNIPAPPKKQFWLYKLIKSTKGIFAVILLVTGVIFLPKQWKENFMSKKEKWEDETFLKGILIPPELTNSYEYIRIAYGTYGEEYFIPDLKNGVEIKINATELYGETPFDLKMKLIGNRIYISATIRYIENSEIVGIVDYERWKLIKGNFIDYSDTDTSLLVIDKQRNIVFSMNYQYPNTIKVKGYYPGKYAVYICDDKGYSITPNKAMDDIKKDIYENLQVR